MTTMFRVVGVPVSGSPEKADLPCVPFLLDPACFLASRRKQLCYRSTHFRYRGRAFHTGSHWKPHKHLPFRAPCWGMCGFPQASRPHASAARKRWGHGLHGDGAAAGKAPPPSPLRPASCACARWFRPSRRRRPFSRFTLGSGLGGREGLGEELGRGGAGEGAGGRGEGAGEGAGGEEP